MRQPRRGSNRSAPTAPLKKGSNRSAPMASLTRMAKRTEPCGACRVCRAAMAKRPVPDPNPRSQSKGGGRRVRLGYASQCPICAFCRLFSKLLGKGRHIRKDFEDLDGIEGFTFKEGMRRRALCLDFQLKHFLMHLPDGTIHTSDYVKKMLPIIKSEPLFIELLSERPNFLSRFIFQKPIFEGECKEGHKLVTTFSIDEEGVFTNTVLEFLPEEVIVLATCNGLVCCQSRKCAENFVIYICKPSTKEWTSLRAPRRYIGGAFGLAYDLLSASHFKVVSARRSTTATNVYLFDIYCSRTRTWRTSKGICRSPYDLQKHKSFYVNNAIHWLTSDNFIILFDVEKEESAVIRKPVLHRAPRYPAKNYITQKYSECLGEINGELGCLRIHPYGVDISGYSRFFFCSWSIIRSYCFSTIEKRIPRLLVSGYGKSLELEALGLKGPVIYLRQREKVFSINTYNYMDIKHIFSLPEKMGFNNFDCSSIQFCSGNIMVSHACREHSPFSKSTDLAAINWYQKTRSARSLSRPVPWSVNDDILREVLSWLPVKSLSRMKCVSKQWRNLISDASLIRNQLQRSKSAAGFLVQEQHRSTCLKDTSYFFPIDAEDIVESFLKFLPERVFIVASCNGLICCRSLDKTPDPLIYICNPTLKQWIYVRPNIERVMLPKIIGLAFDTFNSPCGTPGFKLVVVHWDGWPAIPGFKPKIQRTFPLVFEIYSSETNSWRISKETRDWLYELHGRNGIYAMGKLHWLALEGSCILAFDVENDLSLVVRLPGNASSSSGECLGESDGCINYVTSSTDAISVWILVDYCRSDWNLKHQILVHSLVKEPSILPSHRSLLRDTTHGNRDNQNSTLLEVLALKDEILFTKMELVFYAFHLKVGRVKRLGSLSAEEYPSLEPLIVHPNICSLFSVYNLIAKVQSSPSDAN